jgi:hypothetical protein
MKDAVGDVVPQGACGAVDVRRLAAGVAVGADQGCAAIQACAGLARARCFASICPHRPHSLPNMAEAARYVEGVRA